MKTDRISGLNNGKL